MLDATMTQQLKTYLANLREPVELVASLGEDAKSAQTRELRNCTTSSVPASTGLMHASPVS